MSDRKWVLRKFRIGWASSSANKKRNKLKRIHMESLSRALVENKQISALTKHLDAIRDKTLDMIESYESEESYLIERSLLKSLYAYLNDKCKEGKVDCLEARLTYLEALKKMSLMHWVLYQLHKNPNNYVNWKPKKMDTHCLPKFKYVMKFIYASQCRFIPQLQCKDQSKQFGKRRNTSPQPGSQSKWLHRQREVARALMNRLDRKGFRNLYRVREEQLASAISLVNCADSNSRSLSIAHAVVRHLLQYFCKDYSVWKQCV